MPSCFAACVPPNFRLFLFLLARSLLLVCGSGGAACRSPHPVVAIGLSHLQLGGTRGTTYTLLHMSPNLQTDLSLVFVVVVLG